VKQAGVTLIEMMIVLVLFGLLAVAGVSFTGRWADSNRVLDGNNLLVQGFNLTKAAALRNEFGQVQDTPAAALCFGNQVMSVRAVDSTGALPNCAGGTGKVLWRTSYSAQLHYKFGSSDVTCACLNNKGLLTTTNCSGCLSGSPSINVISGDENVTVSLF